MPAETYASTAYGAVRRIRNPHPHDVLSGRGGGINGHRGNVVFREWVAERKEEYNLAPNKQEKTRVAMEVVDKVKQQDPPGRFLQRDPSAMTGPVWWVEVDDTRALAKTSQALREGAPQIRLAHKEELANQRAYKAKKNSGNGGGTGTGKRKRKTIPTTTTKPQQQVPPVPSSRPFVRRLPSDEYNQAMAKLQANVRQAKDLADQQERTQHENEEPQQSWEPQSKRYRTVDENTPHVSPGSIYEHVREIDGFSETPPLLAVPSAPSHHVESLDLGPCHQPQEAFQQAVNTSAPSTKSLPRVHSLALSDYSFSDTNVFDDNGEFVNPFEDESNIAQKVLRRRQTSSTGSNHQLPSDHQLRNLSSNEDNGMSEPGLDRHWENHQHQSSPYIIPELITDENDDHFHGSWETDFGEGMKSIMDAVRPDVTEPSKGEELPTLLFPWRGNGSGILSDSNNKLSRRTSFPSRSNSKNNTISLGLYDQKQ